jgi:pre-mRNA cleavage complex 2 protein Pcf11
VPPAAPPPPNYPAHQSYPPTTAYPPGPSSQPFTYGTFEPPKPQVFEQPPAPANAAITIPAPSVSVPDVSSLFQSLVKSGVLSNTGTPTGAGATAKAETPEGDTKPSSDSEKEDLRAYRAAVFAEAVSFTSADITRYVVMQARSVVPST